MTHRTAPSTWLAIALLAAAPAAHAGDDARTPLHVPSAYTQECAACHLAYPPGMLPARSWRRMMGSLDRHYGSDASLDAATVATLSDWLAAHAGSSRRVRDDDPPQDRITRSAWFERKHRRLDAASWAHPEVKSAANCAACHPAAARGEFDDDDLRLPRGLVRRDRRDHRPLHD